MTVIRPFWISCITAKSIYKILWKKYLSIWLVFKHLSIMEVFRTDAACNKLLEIKEAGNLTCFHDK